VLSPLVLSGLSLPHPVPRLAAGALIQAGVSPAPGAVPAAANGNGAPKWGAVA
jgi:hypothetical protein